MTGLLEQLIDRVTKIEHTLDQLVENTTSSDFITIAGIAKDIGRGKEWISRNPWVLPGPPDLDGKPKQWLRSRWNEYKKGLPEHRRRWPVRTLGRKDQP